MEQPQTADPQLLAYVQQARASGMTDDQIRRELLKSAWAETDIEAVLLPPIANVLQAPLAPVSTQPLSGTAPLEAQPKQMPQTKKGVHICSSCGYVGKPSSLLRGSIFIEIILWLLFIVPGLIYSIWRLTTRYYRCPSCLHQTTVPVETPAGQQLLEHFNGGQTSGEVNRQYSVSFLYIVITLAAILFLVFFFIWIVGMSGSSSTNLSPTPSLSKVNTILYKDGTIETNPTS